MSGLEPRDVGGRPLNPVVEPGGRRSLGPLVEPGGRRSLGPLVEPGGRRSLGLLVGLLTVVALGCASGSSQVPMRAGTSGDYAPFSVAESSGSPSPARSGFDIALARAFAEDMGRTVDWVPFAWPELSDGVAQGRFDVAMSGVTVRPERSVIGRFSIPVAVSGAVVLAHPGLAEDGLGGLDRPEVRIAVNAGGHLERVARRTFPRAAVMPLPENDAVRRALLDGHADAVVTDTLEAPHWQRSLPEAVRLGPFTQDRKAYLWSLEAGREGAEGLDAWLLAREADGTLAKLREQWLGAPGPKTATPIAALVASIGERLSLMPMVAEAKRSSSGGASATSGIVRDRARESKVLDAAWKGVERNAQAIGIRPPEPDPVRAFYRAQIEAAVAIQDQTLARPPVPGPRFGLVDSLRPALLRLGDRIAWTLVRIETVPERSSLDAAVAAELSRFGLGRTHSDPLVESILALIQGRASARAISPAMIGSASDAP